VVATWRLSIKGEHAGQSRLGGNLKIAKTNF
jgi:hypothetical protein